MTSVTTTAERTRVVLQVDDLKVHVPTEEGTLKAVDGVSLTLRSGQTLGLVGESGCGKSLTSKTMLRLNPKSFEESGSAVLKGAEGGEDVDIIPLPRDGQVLRSIRGQRIAMIFQEPMTAFSPLYRIGNQIIEAILLHRTSDKEEARAICIEMMRKVGIADAERRIDQYPHEFSGGMLQRAMIAMALSCNPDILIADEPTTALDVTIQAQVLELMKELQDEFGMAILFITHDLAVVAEMCDEVAVMYLGKIVEQASVRELFRNPRHPYTKGLLGSIPKLGTGGQRLRTIDGTVPKPIDRPPMCGFYERCAERIEGVCDQRTPVEIMIGDDHTVSCFAYGGAAAETETDGEPRGEVAP